MKDFFVNYNKADRPWAEWIAWRLEEAGYSTVIQAWDFRPGSNFVLEMHRAAQEAERTVAVLSPDLSTGSLYPARMDGDVCSRSNGRRAEAIARAGAGV